MVKKVAFMFMVCFAVLSMAGCGDFGKEVNSAGEHASKTSGESTMGSAKEETKEEMKKETKEETKKETKESIGEEGKRGQAQGKINTDFKPGFRLAGPGYQPLALKPKAPEYQVEQDLANIENAGQFANLTQKQKDMIKENGFVVSPTSAEQLFYIYEENTYKKVPSFITADSVLQLYHIFYDYSLRNLETNFFYDDLAQLNQAMINQLAIEYGNAKEDGVKEGVWKAMGYFGIANLALGKGLPADFPPELASLANQEYGLIQKAGGTADSPLFGIKMDYSLFQVRGHYTRSQKLGQYFQAMSWYGLVPFPFYQQNKERDVPSAIRAITIALALSRAPADKGAKLWENIYSTTSFFVGQADDITPYEVANAIKKVYSDTPDINEIPGKLDEFYAEVDKMKKPQILEKTEDAITQPQMRFMGQRYIPDSEILQNLTEPYKRPFPTGLDVFGVFGSPRAQELLDEFYQPSTLWSGYQENYDLLKHKFASQPISEQTDNLYNSWLYSLKSLTARAGQGYPWFMKTKAWEDKSLSTALGSWAEIRHDTILYGKQSATECGGDEPPEVVGYVEPNPEFFNRLLWLTTATRQNLKARGFLDEGMDDKIQRMEEMLGFLKTCALKELAGEDLTAEEHATILTYGGTLEYLSSSIAQASDWYLVESDTDKNMAMVADVHTSDGSYLEAGVGTGAEIYVAIPQHGKVYLARGAVFDYYEFVSGKRLTDEEWQEQLKQSPPKRPPFASSYMDQETGQEVPLPEAPYSSGC